MRDQEGKEWRVKYWVIDVDGTMTDSGIYYDEKGNEMKKFCTRDAAGFFAAHEAGMEIMILTGRESMSVRRRMKELKVDYVYQNVKNKKEHLKKFMEERKITGEEIGYIGDDLNDLEAMSLAGFVGCPKDSCREILERADYVSEVSGGHGVVRDVLEYVLRKTGQWETAVKKIYGAGI